jgi:outer membrane protein assembly factor BamE
MSIYSQKKFLFLLTVISILFLSSCSYFYPHRIDIQQGNILEQESINKLEPGMRKDQVQFIMGTPMLTDMFHVNRWDYIYTMAYGHEKRQEARISLFFEDDELINIVGDMRPGIKPVYKYDKTRIVTIAEGEFIPLEDKPWYSWLIWWDEDDSKKKKANEPEPNAVNFSTKVPEILEQRKEN